MADAYTNEILSINPALVQIARALIDSGIATVEQADTFANSVARQVQAAERGRKPSRWGK